MLDEELVRLPAAYRSALVLCYLEGRTQDEAARQLGWTLGTLRGQLERARGKLRARLLRRGVSLPAALFGVALGGGATSTASATAIARLVTAGPRSAVPARVAALADEGARTMFTAKTKLGAAFVFAAGVLAAALGVAAEPGGPPKEPPAAKANTPPAARPRRWTRTATRSRPGRCFGSGPTACDTPSSSPLPSPPTGSSSASAATTPCASGPRDRPARRSDRSRRRRCTAPGAAACRRTAAASPCSGSIGSRCSTRSPARNSRPSS